MLLINCSKKRALFGDTTAKYFCLKKQLSDATPYFIFVPLSDLLNGVLSQSEQKYRSIVTIYNGVDISRFNSMNPTISKDKFRIIGVAAIKKVNAQLLSLGDCRNE